MKFAITITFSKLISLLVLIFSLVLDIENKSMTAFMFALPFVTFLITGKQYLDSKLKT
jgi:hypothetical protein